MTLPTTKLSQLRTMMDAGEWDKALCFAAKFQQLGTQARAITRAADCIKNPGMYTQMGRDITAIKAAGVLALRERFMPKPAKPRASAAQPAAGQPAA